MVLGARHTLEELRRLGLSGTLFRTSWELRRRSGYFALKDRLLDGTPDCGLDSELTRLKLGEAKEVAALCRQRIAQPALDELLDRARDAGRGRILCFGRWVGDFGDPPDWMLDPRAGRRWSAEVHWSKALRRGAGSDIKLTWELGRFPQAYHLCRAAVFFADEHPSALAALRQQIDGFIAQNPPAHGPHFASGQEIAFRLLAWGFATHVLPELGDVSERSRALRLAVYQSATHIERYIDYARKAVHNNHILSEAVGLMLVAALMPSAPRSARWWEMGRALLDEQVPRQFYADGGYIQQSHNYHRLALQVMLWACLIVESAGEQPSPSWIAALDRSVDFLRAHQNAEDGRLPNYGANDGGLPSLLSTCDFSDFRPTLQAAHLRVHGWRIYPEGPWDEEAAWLVGPEALARAPLRSSRIRSRSFVVSGHHVLRGGSDESFATFRCGTVRDRFSQIDMLHADIFWRGQNVLVDGGSYLYNGPKVWHDHFMGTASHSTVQLDGLDQMLHFRRFKTLYWTRARMLDFRLDDDVQLCVGEHYGFGREIPGAVHRRSLLQAGELWVVVDRLEGAGEHRCRLHWLCGDFPSTLEDKRRLRLQTPKGDFLISIHDAEGDLLDVDLATGAEDPPRGWLSRYYGEKVPVPSIAVEPRARLPYTFVTILTPERWEVDVEGAHWKLRHDGAELAFSLERGRIAEVIVDRGVQS